MKKFGRLVDLHRILCVRRGPLSTIELQTRLQCSRATVMRLLSELRSITRDPIPYDRDQGGFRYLEPEKQQSDLPSLWFTADELYALLVIRHQLRQMQPGLLAEALGPLDHRLGELLAVEGVTPEEIRRRIRLISLSRRPSAPTTYFSQCAEAVLHRRRLAMRYRSRSVDEITAREISPYRLVAYRDNWYLDAWCHSREGFRRFAVDRVLDAKVLPREVRPSDESELDAYFSGVYGILSGPATTQAVLRFSAERARWVADEEWHPDQRGGYLADGRYQLAVPYSKPAELIMELMKYGPDVEVVEPEDLRQALVDRLKAALQTYSGNGNA